MTTAEKIRAAADQFASYTDAAAAAAMPLQQLSDYMAGRRDPTTHQVRRLADAWGVGPGELIGD